MADDLNSGLYREEIQLMITLNPLIPNIHKQILQTGLHTFRQRMSSENLFKDQGIFS